MAVDPELTGGIPIRRGRGALPEQARGEDFGLPVQVIKNSSPCLYRCARRAGGRQGGRRALPGGQMVLSKVTDIAIEVRFGSQLKGVVQAWIGMAFCRRLTSSNPA